MYRSFLSRGKQRNFERVFSKSVRKAKKVLPAYVRNPRGYIRFNHSGALIVKNDTEIAVSYIYKVSNGVTDLQVDDESGDK